MRALVTEQVLASHARPDLVVPEQGSVMGTMMFLSRGKDTCKQWFVAMVQKVGASP